MSVDISNFRQLPVADKLRLVELLWDDIRATGDPIALHAWQSEEANRRSEQLRHQPEISINRDELWRRIDG